MISLGSVSTRYALHCATCRNVFTRDADDLDKGHFVKQAESAGWIGKHELVWCRDCVKEDEYRKHFKQSV